MSRAILIFALVVLSMAASVSSANTDRDPTRPLAGVVKRPAAQASGVVPQLTSVLVGDTRRLAVIDGKVMAEGEERAGVKVWQIQADRVVVSVAGRKPMTLMLDTARIHKEVR